MKRFTLFVFCFFVLSLVRSSAQDISQRIQAMKSAYAASGSIVTLDGRSIVIEPKMPSPVCGVAQMKDGKVAWIFYTFPLASVTVPLALVDESLIGEDRVFTNPNVTHTYKPGDVGDTTMVTIAGLPGMHFHSRIYDRAKFAQLGPGPHASSEYGQAPDDTDAFGLMFPDAASAHTFEIALKEAVILARSKIQQP